MFVVERDALQAEVATLQPGATDWEKRAGHAKLSQCNLQDKKSPHLCVWIDKAAGTYSDTAKGETYMVIKGY